MDCEEAKATIKRFLEIFVRKTPREIRLLITSELTEANLMRFAAASYHIRECKERKCSLLREHLETALNTASGLGEGMKPTFKY